MPAGTLFGMPSREYLGQNLSWTYNVVYYNYTCSYGAPSSITYPSPNIWGVDQAEYTLDLSVPGGQPVLWDRTGFFSSYRNGGYDIAPASGKFFH